LLTPPTASGSKAEQVTGYKGESWEKKREEEENLSNLHSICSMSKRYDKAVWRKKDI
jgi:hypothetical protein